MRPCRLLLRIALELWPAMLLAVVVSVATVAAGVGLLGCAAYIIATAALHPPLAQLRVAIVGVRFFGLARGVLRYGERLLSHRATLGLLTRLRVRFFSALEPLAPARLLDRRSAELVGRAITDIAVLEPFAVRVLLPPLTAVLVGLGVAVFLAPTDRASAVVFACAYLASAVAIPAVVWRSTALRAKRLARLRGELAAGVVDLCQGAAELAAWGREGDHLERLTAISMEIESRRARQAAVEGWAGAAVVVATSLTVGAVCWVMAAPVAAGSVSGVLLAVACLVVMAAFEAVTPLPAAAVELRGQLASAARVTEILDAEPAVRDRGTLAVPPVAVGVPELEMQGVSFRYPGAAEIALHEVDLVLRRGERVAVVGPSGAGKTTLLHLLLRFWDPGSGHILLRGVRLEELALEGLRRTMGVVAQRCELFAGSVADNLRLARPDASHDDLEEACRHAQIHGQLVALPTGYDSWIGELGLQLSGGQRQRIAVARLLLQDPELLLVDEPTAHLDTVTARDLLDTIFRVAGGRTVLHITHRLWAMERYHRIVVLDRGRVVEEGTHHELVAGGGTYRQLWDAERASMG